MFSEIVQDFARRMESRLAEITEEFLRKKDFSGVEAAMNEECARLNAELQQAILQTLLNDAIFLSLLKVYAGTRGMKYNGHSELWLTLSNGRRIRICSPYFIKAKPHSRRTKRGRNGTGSHVGLEILGFLGQVSPGFLSDVVQMALLCPSYDVACTILKGRGINLDVKALRRLCQVSGNPDRLLRGRIALDGQERLRGYTLVISIDGGRVRERKRKRGRKSKHLKRQGYHAEWREPKLFTIYLTDAEGKVIKEFKPLIDATMGDCEAMFVLLEDYLKNLELEQLDRIVFCGDGAPWIWNGVEALSTRMGFDENLVIQVLDYTHAKQNLEDIIELVPTDKQPRVRKKWVDLLWNGQMDALELSIRNTVTGKANQEKAMKKFTGFFAVNRQRMRYAWFKAHGLPCGSGHVESAIRRVINLRLKAPGTFWLKEMVECFLFLRSQLLSGRWGIFMTNLTGLARQAFMQVFVTKDAQAAPPKAA